MRMGWLIVAALLISATPAAAQAAATLTWQDNATDETGQEIERAPGLCATPGTWIRIATVAPNIMTYVDTTVIAGQSYCYRLRAIRDTSVSPYSNLAQFSPPLAPANLQAR